jgi:hypothetical protein
MSQTSCARYGLLVPMRWLRAGEDLSRPGDVDQSADRPVMRSEGLSKCPRHAPGPPLRAHIQRVSYWRSARNRPPR